MSPFRGLTWSEADRKAKEESKKAEELKTMMKEHDYSECYCHALKKPPWGGYSIEEQILFEAKQRRKPNGRAEPQDVRKSRYSYRYANNSLTGEIVINEPLIVELFTTTKTKSVCIHASETGLTFNRIKRNSVNEPSSKVLGTVTDTLENINISNSTNACTR